MASSERFPKLAFRTMLGKAIGDWRLAIGVMTSSFSGFHFQGSQEDIQRFSKSARTM
jgi:hypothetical protein